MVTGIVPHLEQCLEKVLVDVEDVHDRGNLLRQVLEHLDSLEARSV